MNMWEQLNALRNGGGRGTTKQVVQAIKTGATIPGAAAAGTAGATAAGSAAASGAATGTAAQGSVFPSVPKYQESDAVKQARKMMESMDAAKPGAYQSQWTGQMTDLLGQIQGRQPFLYDLNTDALYNQYRQGAMRDGKLAMMDTIGQAAAMNGGYGSSYGQMAGQQAYNSELQKLNDRIPELYQLAYDKYRQEGNDMLDQFGLMGQMESLDYGRYQDQMQQWQNERNFAADRFDTERSMDYGMWGDELSRQQESNASAQKLAQSQADYMLSMGIRPSEDMLAKAGYSKEYIDAIMRQFAPIVPAAGGFGGYGGGSSSGGEEKETTAKKPATVAQKAMAAEKEGYDYGEITRGLENQGVDPEIARQAAIAALNGWL